MQIQSQALLEVRSSQISPFKEGSSKIARILRKSFYHDTLMKFSQGAFLLTKFFNSRISDYFYCNSIYHEKISKKAINYIFHDIVDFSINTPRPRIHAVSAVAKDRIGIEDFQNLYPSQNVEELIDYKPTHGESIPPDQIDADLSKGVCLGMSVHFVFSFLQEFERLKQALPAIQKIAPIYAAGAPESAELLQIIDQSEDKEKLKAKIHQLSADAQDEIEQTAPLYSVWNFITFIFYLIRNIITLRGPSGLKRFYEEQAQQIVDRFSSQMDHITANRMATQVMGLEGKQASSYVCTDSFDAFYSNLDEGVYLIRLSPEKIDRSAHAIAFIKMGEMNYLFDPNNGTFSFPSEESIPRLKEKIQDYQAHRANFCRYSLKSNP